MTNPLLDFSALPRFDAIRPEHIAPAIDTLLADADAAVARATTTAAVTWDDFVEPLHDATERLGRAWNQVGHLNAVVNTPELREAYNAALPRVTRFHSALQQNQALYERFRALSNAPEATGWSPARRRVVDNALRDFRLGGAELEPDARARLAQVQQELAELSAKFSEHVLDATDAWSYTTTDEGELAGLPDDVRAQCRAAADAAGEAGWRLGLKMPCYLPVQTWADNRALRERLYRAYGVLASETGPAELDNGPLIDAILALRAEQARLLGHAHYAELALTTRMARTADEVLAFLRDLASRALPHARRDRAELEAFARDSLGIDTLQPWDLLAWASQKLREARFSYSGQEVKRYFTEPRVLAGLFDVIESLYSLRVEQDSAPVWHEDVRFYRLVDGAGRLVGQFYLDLYAREGKRGGAWMDDCRNRRHRADGSTQTPIVYLVCNFGRGVDGAPATFTHDEVTTLFHEMGHGLHQLLTEVGELPVAGINGVEWDAVELPSQFMENFCWEWPWVEAMTAHVDTGEPLPHALFERMLAARNFQSGMQTVRQLEFALFDMELHAGEPPADVLALLERIREEVAVNRPPAWHRFPHQFAHIFAGGYAAGYYSYKWAEVLSADAYAAFEEQPDALAGTGARFRREILARGGSRPALENFRAFRGRDPQIDALLRHNGMAA
ncbi:M3 family metallopeptidase [Luteimonas sp. YGD11-2]|uniref:M3 family metallopeptidase n=1 Tax=Luteimonas sp. YGD11-2 TaxID=2508168 RepID=UPI00100B46F3|nr:M3 family metallopeptidase [Luteimonas sp. YGD11-2]